MRFLRRLLHRPYFFLYAAIVTGTVVAAILLPRALAPLAAAERVFAFLAAVFTALSAEAEESKTGKFVLILLLPWLGALLCFVALRPATKPPERKTVLFEGIRLPLPPDLTPATATDARFFPVGEALVTPFLCDLQNARTSIYMEYYIVAFGEFWGDILRILEEKAQCGVDVRVLFDDFGCAFNLPANYPKRLKSKKIKAKFLRKMGFSLKNVNVRDHRKLTVVDGKTAYLGGINLSDEYIGKKLRFGHWKDSALRLTGPIAAQFEEEYLRAWEEGNPRTEDDSEAENANAVPVFDEGFFYLLEGFAFLARKRLFLTTPYLAPDARTESALIRAARAGVDVKILIPHIPDKKSVFLLTRRNAERLIARGIDVREYAAGFLHAKNVVCDGELSYVGSHNLDFRSLKLQRECGVLVKDGALNETIAHDFLAAWETSVPVKKQTIFATIAGEAMRLVTPLV